MSFLRDSHPDDCAVFPIPDCSDSGVEGSFCVKQGSGCRLLRFSAPSPTSSF